MALILEMEEEKKDSDEEEENDDDEKEGSEADDDDDNKEENGASGDEDEDDRPPKKKHKSKDKDDEEKPKKKKKKKEFQPVGDDDLDDYNEEEKTLKLNDEELALRLQAYEERGRSTRNRAAKKSPAPKKEKKERKKNDGNSPYSRPCLLSPELSQIMGKDRMARNEVVKRMWEIVKERKLEDPKDRRYMLCDEELLKVFGKKRVQTFGMMKELKHHIKDEKDVTLLSRDSKLDTDIYDDEADGEQVCLSVSL